MESKRVRFRSPVPQKPAGFALEEFIAAGPEILHNPWPELVDSTDLGVSYANPLIRLWYVPVGSPDDFLFARNSFEQSIPRRVTAAHEYAHLLLDFTPAKEQARYALAGVYHDIVRLLALATVHDDPDREEFPDIWFDIWALNEVIGDIFGRIRLSEELLATAFGFSMVAREIEYEDDSQFDLLAEYLDNWIETYDDDFVANIGGFSRVVGRLVYSYEVDRAYTALARLGIYLQPAGVGADIIDSDEVRNRCMRVAEASTSFENVDDIVNWVTDAITEDELARWEEWLKLLIRDESEGAGYTYARALWALSRGRKWRRGGRPDVWARKARDQYWNWTGHPPNSQRAAANTLLYPRRLPDGRWQIKTGPLEGARLVDDYEHLLRIEAIRQQIALEDAFHCPMITYDHPDECSCLAQENGALHHVYARLEGWSRQGYLDPVRWRLHKPCATGSEPESGSLKPYFGLE